MPKIVKTVSIDLELAQRKMISEVLNRTGETKVQFFKRIIASEHKRIMNGESISDSINKNLESILGTLNSLNPIINKASDDSAAVRNGANTILTGIFFIMKEMFRTMHFLGKFYSKTSALDAKQMSVISNDANIDAAKSFTMFFKTLTESKPKDVVEFLSK